jgi:hypothetical protein
LPRSVKTLSKLAKELDKACGHFLDRELNPMNSPYRAYAINAIQFAAPASNMSDRRRLLALAEEDYSLINQPDRANRWQHPLLRSIGAKRKGVKS